MKTNTTRTAPRSELRTVPPGRKSNDTYRGREHLKAHEVDILQAAAKRNRWGHRDATIILIMRRHGQRVSEVCNLEWADVDLKDGTLNMRRLKGSDAGTHYLKGDEMRALRALKREQEERGINSRYVFVSERGDQFTRAGIAKMIKRAGIEAGLGDHVHPHQLRHYVGYAHTEAGIDTRTLQGFLGHKSINSTTRYAAIAPGRFKKLAAT
jgi:type 1 fimbriae regulatory protein FimB/type 1 fimbriae regulatory protein FimE